jgi:hypothetical protein
MHFLTIDSQLKACLHLQLSLWFLVQFSPFDGCERVGQYQCFECMFPRLYISNWYTRSHPSKGENSSESYKCKQALKVVNWHWNYRQIVKINGEQQHWKLWLKNCCQHVTQLLVFHSLGVGMPMFWVEMCPNEHNVYPVYYTNNLLVNRECHHSLYMTSTTDHWRPDLFIQNNDVEHWGKSCVKCPRTIFIQSFTCTAIYVYTEIYFFWKVQSYLKKFRSICLN